MDYNQKLQIFHLQLRVIDLCMSQMDKIQTDLVLAVFRLIKGCKIYLSIIFPKMGKREIGR